MRSTRFTIIRSLGIALVMCVGACGSSGDGDNTGKGGSGATSGTAGTTGSAGTTGAAGTVGSAGDARIWLAPPAWRARAVRPRRHDRYGSHRGHRQQRLGREQRIRRRQRFGWQRRRGRLDRPGNGRRGWRRDRLGRRRTRRHDRQRRQRGRRWRPRRRSGRGNGRQRRGGHGNDGHRRYDRQRRRRCVPEGPDEGGRRRDHGRVVLCDLAAIHREPDPGQRPKSWLPRREREVPQRRRQRTEHELHRDHGMDRGHARRRMPKWIIMDGGGIDCLSGRRVLHMCEHVQDPARQDGHRRREGGHLHALSGTGKPAGLERLAEDLPRRHHADDADDVRRIDVAQVPLGGPATRVGQTATPRTASIRPSRAETTSAT